MLSLQGGMSVCCGPQCSFHLRWPQPQARPAPAFSRDCLILMPRGVAPEFACGVALAPFPEALFSPCSRRTSLIPASRALNPVARAQVCAALPSSPRPVSLGSAIGPAPDTAGWAWEGPGKGLGLVEKVLEGQWRGVGSSQSGSQSGSAGVAEA